MTQLKPASVHYMPAPRASALLVTLLLHALLLFAMLMLWPRYTQRSSAVAKRIEVQLAASPDDLALRQSAQLAPDKSTTGTTITRATTVIARERREKTTREPTRPAIEVRMENPPDLTANKQEATTTDAKADNEQAVTRAEQSAQPPPLPTTGSSSVVGSEAQHRAVEAALKNKSVAQQANEQLGLGKPGNAQAFANSVKQAELLDCLAPNGNGSLLSLLFIAKAKAQGKCK